MNKVTPFIWFDNNAAEAIEFYQSLFDDFTLSDVQNSPDGKFFSGNVKFGNLELVFFNGGPHYSLTPAFSLYVDCDSQDEVDNYWNAFIENGGTPSQCGWLMDKYGVSWQVIPKILPELLRNPNTAQRAMGAMFKMTKIIINDLERAIKD